MQVNRPVLARAGKNSVRFPGAASRAVDALPVLGQPCAHLLQAFDLARFDATVGHRTDIEEQVAVSAGAEHQRAQALFERLHRVIRFPGPLLANGHAGFPGALVLVFADALLRRVVIARIRHRLNRGAGHAIPGLADAVVDDDGGLELEAIVVEVASPLRVPGSFPLPVEPEQPDGAVMAHQFAQLRFEVIVVAVHVGAGLLALAARTAQRIVRMPPVANGMVSAEDDSLPLASRRQLLHHVPSERGVHDAVIGLFRVPQAETVVMFGR